MGMFDNAVKAANAEVRVGSSYLPAGIHTVKFTGVDKAANERFNMLQFTFEDANGAVHIESMFEPTSSERQANRFDSSREDPSETEQFLCKLMHIMAAINPEVHRQIQSGEVKFNPADFDTLVKYVKKIFDPKVGTEVQIKLLPNGRFARFPGFPAAIDKNGNLYLRTSFVGQDLTLSAYEKQQIDKAANAKPTTMPTDKSELDDMRDDLMGSSDDDSDLPF